MADGDEPERDRRARDAAMPWQHLQAWLEADRLTRTPPRPCPYLPGLQARERAFLAESLDPEAYHELMDRGFRRSGTMFYATDCEGCRRCVPLRVPVAGFTPSRSQRRVLRKNADVSIRVDRPEFRESTWEMYCRYLRYQHGPSTGDETAESFRASLYAEVVDTVEVTYSIGERAVAVSLVDVCSRSVSAVYHFYEPSFAHRSLGVYSVLAEIAWARQIGVPHYYLGFWVEGCKTMHYKAAYRPHELLCDGGWQPAGNAPPSSP